MRRLWFKEYMVAPIVTGEKTDTFRPPLDKRGRCILPKIGETVGLSVGATPEPFAVAVVIDRDAPTTVGNLEGARREQVRLMYADIDDTDELVRIEFFVTDVRPNAFPALHA